MESQAREQGHQRLYLISEHAETLYADLGWTTFDHVIGSHGPAVLMTKGLTICDVNELTLNNGKTVDWRKAVATKLLDLQKADGSWQNSAGRWWEKDPALVTAYAIITLEMIYRRI